MAYIGNNSLPFDPTRTAAQPRDAERFNGDGSTVNFTLSRTVNNPTDVEVSVENVRQEPTVAYNIVGTTLTFTEAPPSGTYNIYVVYRAFNGGQQVTVPDGSITYAKLANNLKLFTTDNLTPNGNNSVFTLSDTPPDANTIIVSVDGIVQRAPVHYTTSGSTITFTSAPPAGSNVHVRHLGIRTTETLTAIAANTTIPQPTITSPVINGAISLSGATIDALYPAIANTTNIGSTSQPFAVGHFNGIKFPATQVVNTDPNTLDDYEEGNWTPAIGVSSGTVSYSQQIGRYVKIGRIVHVLVYVTFACTSTGVTINDLTGLPYAVESTVMYPQIPVGNFYNINIGSGGTVLGLYPMPNGTYMRFHSCGNNTGQLFPLTTGSSGMEIRIIGSYLTGA